MSTTDTPMALIYLGEFVGSSALPTPPRTVVNAFAASSETLCDSVSGPSFIPSLSVLIADGSPTPQAATSLTRSETFRSMHLQPP